MKIKRKIHLVFFAVLATIAWPRGESFAKLFGSSPSFSLEAGDFSEQAGDFASESFELEAKPMIVFEKTIDVEDETLPEIGVVCGNGRKDYNEECDGSDFGDLTCSSFGFARGELQCTRGCNVTFTECKTARPDGLHHRDNTSSLGGSSNNFTMNITKVTEGVIVPQDQGALKEFENEIKTEHEPKSTTLKPKQNQENETESAESRKKFSINEKKHSQKIPSPVPPAKDSGSFQSRTIEGEAGRPKAAPEFVAQKTKIWKISTRKQLQEIMNSQPQLHGAAAESEKESSTKGSRQEGAEGKKDIINFLKIAAGILAVTASLLAIKVFAGGMNPARRIFKIKSLKNKK